MLLTSHDSSEIALKRPDLHQNWHRSHATESMSWHICRLAEEEILKHITTTDACIQRHEAKELLRSWFLSHPRRPGLALSGGSGRQDMESQAEALAPMMHALHVDSSSRYIISDKMMLP